FFRAVEALPDGSTDPNPAGTRTPSGGCCAWTAGGRDRGAAAAGVGERLLMKTVLIIEDDPKIAAALKVRLAAARYEVITAGDGFSGLKLAMGHKPDLILLDIMMPVGMGFSVAERLKDLGLGRIPIIFITASKRA